MKHQHALTSVWYDGKQTTLFLPTKWLRNDIKNFNINRFYTTLYKKRILEDLALTGPQKIMYEVCLAVSSNMISLFHCQQT
jgi:hypothetical protein